LIKGAISIIFFPITIYIKQYQRIKRLTKEIKRLNYVIERKQYHLFNQNFRCSSPTRLEETTTTQTRTMYFD